MFRGDNLRSACRSREQCFQRAAFFLSCDDVHRGNCAAGEHHHYQEQRDEAADHRTGDLAVRCDVRFGRRENSFRIGGKATIGEQCLRVPLPREPQQLHHAGVRHVRADPVAAIDDIDGWSGSFEIELNVVLIETRPGIHNSRFDEPELPERFDFFTLFQIDASPRLIDQPANAIR